MPQRDSFSTTSLQPDELLWTARSSYQGEEAPVKADPMVVRCGGPFNCPLPNLHAGLCQPMISKRCAPRRGAPGRKPERTPSSYVNRVQKVEKEKKAKIQIGPDFQVASLPEWCRGACTDDRGDIRVGCETKQQVQAAFRAEREAALAWEAGRAQRHAGTKLSLLGSEGTSEGDVTKLLTSLNNAAREGAVSPPQSARAAPVVPVSPLLKSLQSTYAPVATSTAVKAKLAGRLSSACVEPAIRVDPAPQPRLLRSAKGC